MKVLKISLQNNKIKTYPDELKGIGKFLNLENDDSITLLFMKWCYLPYDFKIKEDEETINTLNFKVIQVIAEALTNNIIVGPTKYDDFIGKWCALNHYKALDILKIDYEKMTNEDIINAIKQSKNLNQIIIRLV